MYDGRFIRVLEMCEVMRIRHHTDFRWGGRIVPGDEAHVFEDNRFTNRELWNLEEPTGY